MDLHLTASEAAFRDELVEWLHSVLPSLPSRPPERDYSARRDFDTHWQQLLHGAGYAGINWPKEFGGRGATPTEHLIYLEESQRLGAPKAETHFVGQEHAGPTLIMEATAEQKNDHLPRILNGTEVWCQGFSEPNAGSDLASLSTRAVRDGDYYVVTGQKIWTSFAHIADYCELLVRTNVDAPKHRGITWLICPMDLAGIEARPIRTVVDSSEFCETFFDEVRVPVANRVGDENDGWRVAMVTFSFERGTGFLTELLSAQRELLELVAVAKKVTRRGALAWDDAEIRRELGHLQADFDALWALTKRNVSQAARTGLVGPGGSVFKLAYADVTRRMGELAFRLLDRMALTTEPATELTDVELAARRIRSFTVSIAAGTSQIQRNIIGERILGLPRGAMSGIYEIIRPHADAAPDRVALISDAEGIRTYGAVVAGAERFAHGAQHQLGLEIGDRVCIWLTNRFEWFDAYIGASAIGVATVQANPAWSDKEMLFVLAHSQSRALVCEPTHVERACALAAQLPDLEHIVVVGDDAVPADTHSFSALLQRAPTNARDELRPAPALFVAGLMYTSGTTTGRPKAVAHNSDVQGRQVDYVEMFGVDTTDRIMFVTPLFHANAMGAWQCALGYGASAVFQRKFSASTFWSVVDQYRPSVLFTLAPIVNILMGRPASPIERTNRFRVMIVLGSGPNAPAIEERFGAPVIDWYGMTEAGNGTYTRLGDERRPGSAGRPFPDSTMRVLRDDGTEAAPGEVGEVGFRLESIHFGGYVDDDEANAAAMRDGWFLTGDLGYFDDDGYFFFVDRKKDIVRRGGVNVSSIEVETVLRSHPLVADVAIVAKSDPMLGERIVAFVVCAGTDPPTVDMLRTFAAGELAAYKLPDAVLVVDELPRTASGKVEKFRLRSLL